MATSNATLSCTGTGTATVKRDVQKVQTVTSTAVISLLRFPRIILTTTLVSSPVISVISLGIDAFDILEGKRKWIVNGVNRIQLDTRKRFAFLVKGRPYG